MKNDCEIVKDLLPNYVENLLSDETKKYIDEHLDHCGKCRYILKLMKDEKMERKTKDEQENQIEFDHLKKYKKRTICLKFIALIFALILIFGLILFFIKYNKINKIFNNVSSKNEDLKELNNYIMYVTSHNINFETNKEVYYYDEYYYKDKKYKEVSKYQVMNSTNYDDSNAIKYGRIDSNEQISIDEGRKSIINYAYNYFPVSKEKYIQNIYNLMLFYPKDSGFYTLLGKLDIAINYKVRKDRFNGIECYVLRNENKESYIEIWIDKENKLPIREVRDIYNQFYTEKIITLYIGNVKDEDVEFKQEQYEDYTFENKEITHNEKDANVLKQI